MATADTKWLVLAATLLMATPASAGLKDIRTEKLPQDPAVRKAYADMIEVEDYVWQWSSTWDHETPKEQVVSVVGASLAALQKSAEAAPENGELLLLTGLIAHYAHNLDVEGASDTAFDFLKKARRLMPEDYRPEWFLGVHQCQIGLLKEGIDELLSIERQHAWEELPSSFWDDYLYCANLANMPAHALRAGGHAEKLGAQPSRIREFQMEAARKRFVAPDPDATYPAQEVWLTERIDSQVEFTSTMFGFQFSSYDGWKLRLQDVQKSGFVVVIETGPHAGKTGQVVPNILVLARPPKPGESLGDLVNAILPGTPTKPVAVTVCPSEDCLAFETVKPRMYGAEGDGHAIVTAFQRGASEFPGLLFEHPMSPPAGQSEQVAYYRPIELLQRLEGTLYYVILLDTADSVLEKAKADYEAFLKGIRVE